MLLDPVPDFSDWKIASEWIHKGIGLNLQPGGPIVYLDWSGIQQEPQPPFGFYSSKLWRKFVLATFLADLVSYPTPVDQVNFDRLLFVMHAFPEGFRTWWSQAEDGAWWPVGYTGWYPMAEQVFELFEQKAEVLKSRMVVPDPFSVGQNPFLYLFNFSAASPFKKTELTKSLLNHFVQDIEGQKASGLACITVSEEGVRVATKFGMKRSGFLNLEGTLEGVYTCRSVH